MSLKRHRDEVEDASDRAQKHRKEGNVRVSLDEIGIWEHNRGGLGISPFHAHETVWDCIANKTKLARYQQVDLVEVPEEMLPEVRDYNRDKCASDKLMPRFSNNIKYVCGSKTHFVHGHKLIKDGNRTLFDKGDVLMKLKRYDDEGALIQAQGPVSAIYSKELMLDSDAMIALSTDDNLNAGIQLGDDEIQAFGRVHAVMTKVARSQDATKAMTIDQILAQLQLSGLGQFTKDDWAALITLRNALTEQLADVLQRYQFDACAGRVRVTCHDFGLVATLDARAMWAKIAILLAQYYSIKEQTIMQGLTQTTFEGLETIWATKLSPQAMKEVGAEIGFLTDIESFIKLVLTSYKIRDPSRVEVAEALIKERGIFLRLCGKLILRVAASIDLEARKLLSRREVLSPEQRLVVVQNETKDKFSKIEDVFRTGLVSRNLIKEDDLPAAKYPMPVQQKGPPKPAETNTSQPVVIIANADGTVTEAAVFHRLKIKGLDETVMAQLYCVQGVPCVQQEPIENTDGSQPSDGSQPRDSKWTICRLVKLSLPNALVDVNGSQFTVLAADLRSYQTVPKTQPIPIHPSIDTLSSVTALETYDMQLCEPLMKEAVVKHLLAWAHIKVRSVAENVRVYRLSEEGKLPIILQARSCIAFKKGNLCLSPGSFEFVLDDKAQRVKLSQCNDVVHSSMLKHASVKISYECQNKRLKVFETHAELQKKETHYIMPSPLLAATNIDCRVTCMKNISPFWAVLGAAGHRSSPNMELGVTTFRESGFTFLNGQYPKIPGGIVFVVDIPVLRNVTPIATGEILCMPPM